MPLTDSRYWTLPLRWFRGQKITLRLLPRSVGKVPQEVLALLRIE